MGVFHDISELLENRRGEKENRRRGRELLTLREVEAVERIAAGVSAKPLLSGEKSPS